MKIIYTCFVLASVVKIVLPAPANGFVFPDERKERKLEPVITPPVLPVLEHLENDPSTLLPHERAAARFNKAKPRFGGGFNVRPSGNGGLTASVSNSASGPLGSQSASQSFSFGFNEGFSASHSASQSASFNGFGSGFSGSQASSQAASFAGNGQAASGAASSAASLGSSGFGGFGGSQSQSASSAFGFNSLNGFQQQQPDFYGDGLLDIRHRGIPSFPSFPDLLGRSKGVGAAAFRSGKPGLSSRNGDDVLTAIFVSD